MQSGTDKKSVQNERNRKAGDPALPLTDRCAIRKKRFWYVYFATQSTILALEKSTAVPLLTESRKEPVSLPRERKDYSSSKGKREDVPFVL